ncbi:N-acetylmuramoyl-L-alanine amidase [Rossellomorea oryzaecorticis]|uniref:N-acetylmuramoyl-L-alanine amidase n=1 Tax=Rossellomorea oryzaecorticis TaxID=1396505 RepID=A0ABW8VLP3_9BACI
MKFRLLLSLVFFLGLGLFASSVSAATFSDIGNTHRAKAEVYFLSTGNIVKGSNDGYFYPDNLVTRAEAAAMIGRSLQLDGTQIATKFKDVGISSFASGYIQRAVEKKIISGYSDGTFKPEAPVTRGEMALLISRAFEYNATTTSSASDELMQRGIAQGMANGSFGEGLSIKRADFSVFLARAINSGLRVEGQSLIFPEKKYVNTNILNFRSGPSTLYPIVAKLSYSTPVDIAYRIGDWVYARTASGQEGFLHMDFLSDDLSGPIVPEPEPVDPLTEEVIVIDPGHGYPDNGASAYGIHEKDVVLATGLKLQNYFKKTPFNVQMTRTSDRKIELPDRMTFAKRVEGDLFISIHANSFDGSAHGTETYYYGIARTNPYVNESKALATYVQKRLLSAWGLSNRGVKHGDLHVLRENSMPAVLAELGFIDSKPENDKLRSAYWQDLAAKAIFLGTLDYYYHYEKKDVLKLYDIAGGKPSAKLH